MKLSELKPIIKTDRSKKKDITPEKKSERKIRPRTIKPKPPIPPVK